MFTGARSECGTITNEGLMPSSSQCLNFVGAGKPAAWLSHQKRLGQDEFSEREQPADTSRSNESIFRDANPANVAKYLREGNKGHLLTQARSGLMNTKWNLLTIVLMSSSNKLMLDEWIWRAPITDMLNLDENKFDYKKN